MATRIKNRIPKQLAAWWKGQEQQYSNLVMKTAERVANRIRDGYSGVGRQGQDTEGWKHGKAPVEHGALAQSVRTEMDGKFAANILIGKQYGAYIEFGAKIRVTPRMRGFLHHLRTLKFPEGLHLKKSTVFVILPPKPFVRNALRIEAEGFKTRIIMRGRAA